MDIFSKCRNYTVSHEVKRKGYYFYFREISSCQGTEVWVNGKKMIMVGSNNYLGLTTHPKVKEAAINAIKKYGTGCAGSRFLNGTIDLHRVLEERLAQFFSKEAAIVFATGMQANLGTISALVGRGDVALIDRMDHASIIDGCRLSFGEVAKYNHNDMNDLERILSAYTAKNKNGKLIITDGVFSMEGDIVNLPEMVKIAKKYNAGIMVDDAHGIGVLGKTGRGTAEHFGLQDDVDVIMGTYSKSLAAIGGFIAASKEIIEYIKHTARALIFSASLPPPLVAAALAALEVIENEPERREKLWKNTYKMLNGFKSLGFVTKESKTPIIPIVVGEDEVAFEMCKRLHNLGIFTNPVVSPAVPPGKALMRNSFMATHTEDQLDYILECFQSVGKSLGII